MPAVRNAKRAAELAMGYVEDVLRREDLVIEEVAEAKDEWVVTFEGLSQEYELHIDAGTGEILEFTRV